MALSLPNFTVGGGSGLVSSFSSATFTSTTGDLLVCAVRIGGSTAATISTVQNANGQNLTLVPGSTYAQSNQAGAMYYIAGVTGRANDTVTVTLSTPLTFCSICVWDISGADVSSPFDKFATGNVLSGGKYTSGSYTTTSANEIICSALIIDAVNTTFGPDAGYTQDSTGYPVGAGLAYCGAEHKIVAAIQTSVTTAMTLNTSPANGTILVATFKAAPAVGGSTTCDILFEGRLYITRVVSGL